MGYTVPARQVDYADADGHRKVDEYRQGVEDLENEGGQQEVEGAGSESRGPARKDQRSRKRNVAGNDSTGDAEDDGGHGEAEANNEE